MDVPLYLLHALVASTLFVTGLMLIIDAINEGPDAHDYGTRPRT